MKRVAVISVIPTPYRDPFWRCLQELGEIDLDVYYLAEGKADRPWKNDWVMPKGSEVIPGVNLAKWRGVDSSLFWNPLLPRRLVATRYEAIVIGGYNHPSLLWAIAFACRRSIPWFLMCETHRIGGVGGVKDRLRIFALKRIVRSAFGAFPTGNRAKAFLSHFGMSSTRMAELPNVPDIESLKKTAKLLASEREKLRMTFGIPSNARVVMFVGRFIEKKCVSLLIEAFARASFEGPIVLALLGDGPQRRRLEDHADSLGIGEQVLFPGFMSPRELPTWFAVSDLFVLLSSETWGVAPIEAVASGLPVVVSNDAGCADDLRCLVGDKCRITDSKDPDEIGELISESLRCADRVGLSEESDLDSWRYEMLAARFVGLLGLCDNP